MAVNSNDLMRFLISIAAIGTIMLGAAISAQTGNESDTAVNAASIISAPTGTMTAADEYARR